MRGLVIIGAGGHGREVAEIVRHQARQGGQLPLLGFIDEQCDLHNQVIDGLPVLGDWGWFREIDRGDISVLCAVGLPHVCRRLVQRATRLGLTFTNAISPLAHISERASIGCGVVIFPQAVVNTGACIQDHAILNVGATVSHDTTVGQYSNINPGTHLAGNVSIGDGCYIGMGTNVLQGRAIGAWTTVGAGAVVIRDLPANVTAVGVPASIIKRKENGWYD